MKRTSFLLLCLLPLLLSAQTSWVKWWPQPNADSVWPNNIIKTHDGGYAFHWTHNEFTPVFDEVSHLYKTDSLGNLQWEQQWGWYGHTYNTLNQMPDSSYLWGGTDIVHITKEGQIDWIIDLDTLIANGAEIYTSTLTPDGNVVFVALQRDPDFIWWLIKMTVHGNILWIKPYQFHYWPIQIQILTEGKMVAAGHFNLGEVLLLKFTETGDLYGTQIVNHPNIFPFSGMIVDSQTNLLLYGATNQSYQSHLFYLDTLGNVLWDKHIDIPDTNLTIGGIVSALDNEESSFVMVSWGILSNEINAILKINKLGDIEWWRLLPGRPLDGSSQFFSQCNLIMEKTSYVTGLRKGSNYRTIGIAKTDTNGIITKITDINDNRPQNIILHQNFPNPFNPQTTIAFELTQSEFIELKVYNLLGEKVKTLMRGKFSQGYHQVTWNASEFPSGIYFYKLKISHQQTLTKKMLLVK